MTWPEPRATKFRQAAFVYAHVTVLYLSAAYVMAGEGMLPGRFGPPVLWLILGALVGFGIAGALYHWQHVWLARIVWGIHGLRLPALIAGAFFPVPDARTPSTFYLTAIVVVVINLWALARAGWDL